jgi:predicted transposase YdaD
MEHISEFFKEENDYFFRRGFAKGLEKAREERKLKLVENIIVKLGLSAQQVAELADVSVDFVKKARATVTSNKASYR